MPKYQDRVGQEVKVGCKVAFATRKHNFAAIRTAEVTEIVDNPRRGVFYVLHTEASRKAFKEPKEVIVYQK